MTTLVKKASGEMESFSREKLSNSLRRAGADKEATDVIADEIDNWLYEGVSTKKIYKQAYMLLHKHKNGVAARYRLKKAIMELGPTGYPFEHFVGQLIGHYGYEIQVGQILQGVCVQHEVDVVATNNNKQLLIECKFYNSQGKQANVKVPLYINSRVEDIINKRKSLPGYNAFTFQGWVVTNTRFTSDAIEYGKCAGLYMVSWDYPRGRGLKDMIEQGGLFPVTTLTSLNNGQKKMLLDEGIVLCKQISSNPEIVSKLEMNPAKRQKVLDEVSSLLLSAETTV